MTSISCWPLCLFSSLKHMQVKGNIRLDDKMNVLYGDKIWARHFFYNQKQANKGNENSAERLGRGATKAT